MSHPEDETVIGRLLGRGPSPQNDPTGRPARNAARIADAHERERDHPRENRVEVLPGIPDADPPAVGALARQLPAMLRVPSNVGRKGRPPSVLSLSERIRQRVNPDDLIDIALRIAMGWPVKVTDPYTGKPVPGLPDNVPTVREQLMALTWIRDSGYSKPPASVAVLTPDAAPAADLTVLTGEQMSQLEDLLRAAEGLPPAPTDADLSGEG